MTPDEVNRQIRRIRQVAEDGDSELAHHMEDALYKDVLFSIMTDGEGRSARLAGAALVAADLPYQRWYG